MRDSVWIWCDASDPSREPSQASPPRQEEHPYRCPVSGCTGWVSHVRMKRRKPFWGCGECGAMWKHQDALFQGITAAIERYPYRARCYVKDRRGGFLPGDPERELKTYEARVEKEPIEYKEDQDAAPALLGQRTARARPREVVLRPNFS